MGQLAMTLNQHLSNLFGENYVFKWGESHKNQIVGMYVKTYIFSKFSKFELVIYLQSM